MNKFKCPSCGSKTRKLHVSDPVDREYFVERIMNSRYDRCENCLNLFQFPSPTIDETNNFYHKNYQNYVAIKVPFIAVLFKNLQRNLSKSFVNEFGISSIILDFGCNQGLFLELLFELGCTNLHGYDVVEFSGNNKKYQYWNSLEAIYDSGIKFDVIRMNHVIEHLPNIDTTLIKLRKLLKYDGIIIGQTPNASHYTSNLFKSFWGPLHYPYHILLFSKKGLINHASKWGLELQGTSKTIMPTGWAMSIENIIKPIIQKSTCGRSVLYAIFLFLSLPMVFFDFFFTKQTAIHNFRLYVLRQQ
jgi:2-polyprenyl-3-methyl-5-hydroxy-6-metoxy-1,4-benzoquinol methylase